MIMTIGNRILLILTGTLTAVLLQSLVNIFITNFVVTGRNLFGFGGGLILIVIFLLGIWAAVYSLALTFSDSLFLSLIISVIFTIWMSWRPFQSLVEIYQRPDYFDREYFMMDLVQIGANLIIYPMIALLLWNLQKKFV